MVYICGRGVGKWILRLMQEYFKADSGTSEPQDLSEKGISFFFVTFGLQIVHVVLFEGEKPMKVANQFSI